MFKARASSIFGRWACVAAAACTGLLTPVLLAAEELRVRTVSGREFRGELDPLTSREELVLRSGTGGVVIRRPIPWGRIEQVSAGRLEVPVESLRAGAGEAAVRRQHATIDMKTLHVSAGIVDASQVQPSLPLRVASIGFDAGLANWDGDVEMDGMFVELSPLDIDGRLLPVGGTVEVELFAPQRRSLDLAPQSGGDTLELVERWTRAVSASDFGPNGARLRLPFGAIHPELRPDWVASHYGLVHVRLAAPGHGVFEASRDGVRTVPWAPNRDRLEMQTGGRFLWTEGLGRPE